MEIESLFGLPAHPLLVHALVVLVPLVTLGVVASALWRPARRALAPTTLLLAGVVTVLTPFVTGSGESLEDHVDRSNLVHEHAELAEGFVGFAVLLLIAAAVVAIWWWFERAEETPAWLSRRGVRVGVALGALVLAVIPTVRILQIGHSGAKATWNDQASEGHGDDDDD